MVRAGIPATLFPAVGAAYIDPAKRSVHNPCDSRTRERERGFLNPHPRVVAGVKFDGQITDDDDDALRRAGSYSARDRLSVSFVRVASAGVTIPPVRVRKRERE